LGAQVKDQEGYERRRAVKIKIDESGFLWVDRAGVITQQFCKREMIYNYHLGMASEVQIPCGDWCPLFQPDADVGIKRANDALVVVTICEDRSWRCGPADFTDERAKGDNPC
jgi:hypothetical protein